MSTDSDSFAQPHHRVVQPETTAPSTATSQKAPPIDMAEAVQALPGFLEECMSALDFPGVVTAFLSVRHLTASNAGRKYIGLAEAGQFVTGIPCADSLVVPYFDESGDISHVYFICLYDGQVTRFPGAE